MVGSATEPATDPSASIIVTSTPVADHGGVIETSAQMIPPPESFGAYQRTSGPQIVITRDDVVVATIVPLPAQYDELELVVNYDPRFSPATFVTHSVPVVCDDGSGTGSAGAALPPGDYQVMAVGDLWWTTYDRGDSGHPTTADGLPGWDPVSVVAAPVPLRITDAPGEPLDAPTGAPPLPPAHDWQLDYQCQEPPESTTTPALTASGSSETRYISSGERMRVDMTMAFSGPGRVSANMSPGLLMLRRDGKTIGVVSSNFPPSKDANIDAGTQIPFTTIADDYRACGEDEEPGSLTPIPAGTYEAYPMISVYVNGLYSSDGELLFTEDEVWTTYAVSTPFTLVVS
jgi:antitoxin (DNA-binding transcriptional repressor) of toxin-antitoxin stability system